MACASVLEQICGGLIVSCQALQSEALHGTEMMVRMALAARSGGAIGIRANGHDDIYAIKQAVQLPVIGIVKRMYEGSEVYITPTLREVEEVARAGADIVAVDATHRPRPAGESLEEFIRAVKTNYPSMCVMADVSTFAEAVAAERCGVDIVASTMSGYTAYSPNLDGPDFILLERMVGGLQVPVIAEGRVHTPEQARRCREIGAIAVVVGSAITRPQEITRAFVEHMKGLPPRTKTDQHAD